MDQIIECVPNFSEGKDPEIINSIADAIHSIEGVKLLHIDSGEAANRTVYTFAGEVDAVIEAAYQAAQVATEKIDMRKQKGEHPRIGALDVCPFIPISGITIQELIPKVNAFASRLNTNLGIPIYLYEESSRNADRRNLAQHRLGGYEALEKRISSGEWLPDLGKDFNAKSGGTVCGVRKFLLAFNVNIANKQLEIAKMIAYSLRESGWPEKLKDQKESKFAKHLAAVKAIAWYIKDFDKVQVSINLSDFEITPLWKVFEECKELATKYGAEVTGSELIGLIPLKAILECGAHFHPAGIKATNEELISFSIKELGLNELEDFNPNQRILDYLL